MPHTITIFLPVLLALLIPNTTANHTITYTKIHTSLSYNYCHLTTFYLVRSLKKQPNDNKYKSELYVFVLIHHNNTLKPQL